MWCYNVCECYRTPLVLYNLSKWLCNMLYNMLHSMLYNCCYYNIIFNMCLSWQCHTATAQLLPHAATVTCSSWPLSYCHIQQLSLYSLLLLPLPALVLATVPLQLPNLWGRVGMPVPATKPCIIGTRPNTFSARLSPAQIKARQVSAAGTIIEHGQSPMKLHGGINWQTGGLECAEEN
jgi:hypothetical protein